MKKKFKFNIDKLKVCVIAENDSLFEQLSKAECAPYIEEFEGFKIHLLAKYEDSVKIEDTLTSFVKRIVMSIEDMEFKEIGKLTISTCKGEISGFFEFSNRALYQKNVCLNHILSSLRLKLCSITTIEVALDLNFDFTRKLMRFIRDAENYDMILNRKKIKAANEPLKKVYSISAMSRESISKQKTLYLGNEKKTLKTRSYNKSKEIEDGGEKKYIEEWNNFGSSSKMFRVEFTIGWEFFYYEWLSSKGNGKGEDEPFSAYLGRIVDLLRSPMYKLSLWNFCANRQLYFRDKRTGEKLTLLKIATGIKNSQDLNRWIEENIPTVFIFSLSMKIYHNFTTWDRQKSERYFKRLQVQFCCVR